MKPIYECVPGQLPEDIIPDKFLPRKDGRLVSPLVRIGKTEEELLKPAYTDCHSTRKRIQTKNKKRFTWGGEHPSYWMEIN